MSNIQWTVTDRTEITDGVTVEISSIGVAYISADGQSLTLTAREANLLREFLNSKIGPAYEAECCAQNVLTPGRHSTRCSVHPADV